VREGEAYGLNVGAGDIVVCGVAVGDGLSVGEGEGYWNGGVEGSYVTIWAL